MFDLLRRFFGWLGNGDGPMDPDPDDPGGDDPGVVIKTPIGG